MVKVYETKSKITVFHFWLPHSPIFCVWIFLEMFYAHASVYIFFFIHTRDQFVHAILHFGFLQ